MNDLLTRVLIACIVISALISTGVSTHHPENEADSCMLGVLLTLMLFGAACVLFTYTKDIFLARERQLMRIALQHIHAERARSLALRQRLASMSAAAALPAVAQQATPIPFQIPVVLVAQADQPPQLPQPHQAARARTTSREPARAARRLPVPEPALPVAAANTTPELDARLRALRARGQITHEADPLR